MSLTERALVFAMRRSWRLYGRLSCTVTDDCGVRVPLRDQTGLSLLGAGSALLEELGRLLPERAGAVVDVGANIGSVLVSLLRLGYRDRPYIGFEPQIEAAAYVRALIAVNGPCHLHGASRCSNFSAGAALPYQQGSGQHLRDGRTEHVCSEQQRHQVRRNLNSDIAASSRSRTSPS